MSVNSNSLLDSHSDDNLLVVGAGFTIEGLVRGKGALIIGGMVNGNIEAESVKLTDSGQVVGHIDCQQLDLSGKLHGSFNSTDVIIRPSGSVTATVDPRSSGTCLVQGTLNANLKGNKVKLEASGNLIGSIDAEQLDIYGRVTGDIDVADGVVRSGAFVDGHISYGELAMERGSDVSGQIQRKQRNAGSAAKAVAQTASKSSPTQAEVTPLLIDLPLEALKALRKNPPQDRIRLSLADGSPAPEWIRLDHEQASLALQRSAFDALVADGQAITLRLQIGDDVLTFSLPPSAQASA